MNTSTAIVDLRYAEPAGHPSNPHRTARVPTATSQPTVMNHADRVWNFSFQICDSRFEP